MPEYLAPGVYVEEIDTGSKPIEGVSTSTAGMVGVTERGPLHVPMLITSYGEFTRVFGERLNIRDFTSPTGRHCYLPQATEGFFLNGGKRVYITRVLDVGGARQAQFALHDRGDSNSAATRLLRPAIAGSGNTQATALYVFNINAILPNSGTLAVNDTLRVGDGSDSEYRTATTVAGAGNATHVPLNFPLNRVHDSGVTIQEIPRAPLAGPNTAFRLGAAANAGSTTIDVNTAVGNFAVNELLEIGTQFGGEQRYVVGVTDVGGGVTRVTLDSPLALVHSGPTVAPAPNDVIKLDPAIPGGAPNTTLSQAARAGDAVAFVAARGANFVARDRLVVIDNNNAGRREVRRIGNLSMLTLATGTFENFAPGTTVESVGLADDGTTPPKSLTAPNSGTVIRLNNRVNLVAGDIVRVGIAPNEEYAIVAALPNPAPGGAPPNAGDVILRQPLARTYTNGTVVQRQLAPTPNNNPPTTIVALAVNRGELFIPVSDGGASPPVAVPSLRFDANDIVRFTTLAGTVSYHRLSDNAVVANAQPVVVGVPLERAQIAGAPVAERTPLMTVVALDPGAWGNRLRVSVEDEPSGLVNNTTLLQLGPPIRLASAAGVEVGTVLEFPDVGGPLQKVTVFNRATGDITLIPGLTAAQQVSGTRVRSREFSLTVRLLRQPDVAMPARNETVIDLEAFRYLSLDPRHSRYVHTIVGTTWNFGNPNDNDGQPLRRSDRRSEGESNYVRVRDLAQDLPAGLPAPAPYRVPTLESARLGPEALLDLLPTGQRRPARHALRGGDDSLATLDNTLHYIGNDDPNPDNRTGLWSLRNIEEISIIAAPGKTTPDIQNALILQCEAMRYRFAVLDGPQPPGDALTDVQLQRQQYDTKYAAIYYPWPIVLDPYPANLAQVAEYPIPSSGHVVGVYARTDIERGVHKAPANEVLRGVIGLRRVLNKEQHDILNPYPHNINVLRDFRPNNRGIRVYGGRVMTSDTDWKYVNVRRLLIFIEASIDRGLQWVVFEPNAEPLWARVRRTVSNFLTTVWRNGALEGTKVEEAFFVKCDRTTMTQAEIDNGQLICLIGVAPVKPAEFVIIRIGLWTAHAEE